MKKILSVVLITVMLIGMIPAVAIPASATGYTVDQAMAWCESQVGKALDYDNAYGAQCVDLIYYYYEQFGIPARGGNASDYQYASKVPTEYGWAGIPGATPQKGDIMVWTGGIGGWGHIAICGGSGKYYHQYQYEYVRITSNSLTGGYSYDGYWYNYWGVIRPTFSGSMKCTISYNANGGSGTMASHKSENGMFTLKKNEFTRNGYTFVGWNAHRASDNTWFADGKDWYSATQIDSNGYIKKIYEDNSTHQLISGWTNNNGDETFEFYAVWKPNKLKVQYNANGGTINSDTYKLLGDEIYTKSDNTRYVQTWTYNKTKKNGLTNASTFGISKTGYIFKGWSTSGDGNAIFSQSNSALVPTDFTDDIKNKNCTVTLYAIWQSNHEHIFRWSVDQKATCKAAGVKTYTCTVCGATKTSAIAKTSTHTYNSGTITKKATCKAAGVKTYTCTVCGITKTSTIAKTSTHTYDSGKVTKKATCKTAGVKTYTCTVCGITKTESIAKISNHTYKTTTIKATLTKNGSVVKMCSVCGKVASNTAIKYAKTFKLSAIAYTYNGKVKTPTVTVKDSAGKTLKKGTDYTVTYASGRKNVGTYKVTIKMKGNYNGTKPLTFKIFPKAASVKSLTAKTKALTVKLNRQTTQSTGYQIQYATNKGFKNAKTKWVTSYKTSTSTIKSLKAKTTYYVRVRTYKKVGNATYYSKWSTMKYKKTK